MTQVLLCLKLWKIFEAACGFSVPRGNEQGGLLLQIPQVPSLDAQSFQQWTARLPARLHGWGFRSLVDSCGPAWLDTLETAAPFMAGCGEICEQLGRIWGGPECWAEGASKKDRWRCMIESGCEEGVELQQVWGKIRLEALQCCAFLGEEMPQPLAPPTKGIGEGCVNGSTRGKIVEARENLRAKLLDKVLESLPRSTRDRLGKFDTSARNQLQHTTTSVPRKGEVALVLHIIITPVLICGLLRKRKKC